MMNLENLRKEDSILKILALLEARFGETALRVEDHWEGDRCAVGLVSANDPSKLIYLSTYDLDDGKVDIVCERVAQGQTMPYHTEAEFEQCAQARMIEIVGQHLSLE